MGAAQADLFADGGAQQARAARYPHQPGAKARETSFAAAAAIAPKAMSLRARVFEALKAGPASPEQLAARMGEPLMNLRPRTAELSRLGLIRDTGKRARAQGGRQAIVWEIVPAVKP